MKDLLEQKTNYFLLQQFIILETLLQCLCTVFFGISTFLIHPFHVTGSTSSLHPSSWAFLVGFWRILKPWLIRVILARVNNKCISSSNEWWCLVLVSSFRTCKLMIIYIRLMKTQLIFVLLVNYFLFSGLIC